MDVQTGETGSGGPFEHYEASPAEIESSAEDLDRNAQNIQAFKKQIDAQHRLAVADVSGAIEEPLSTATEKPQRFSTQLMGRTYVASGSIRLFGQGVERFNKRVDELNERYRQAADHDFGVAAAEYPDGATPAEKNEIDAARDEQIMAARVALLRELTKKYRKALAKLDEEAADSAKRIENGPTDETLKHLYSAGVLPSSVELAFPSISFTADALPSDFIEMSDSELAKYLARHPELMDNDKAMAEIARRIEELTYDDGERSGRIMRDALSGRARHSEVEAEFAVLSLVGMYGAYAQSRGKALPEGASQYIHGLFTDLVHGSPTGQDRTMDVFEWITASEHEFDVRVPVEGGTQGGQLETRTETVPGFDRATQDWMLRAYADAILLMSDGTTNGLGRDYIPPDIEEALNDTPKVKSETFTHQSGTYTGVHLQGGDGFAKLADLLGRSSEYGASVEGIRPGMKLATELTESSAETAAAINQGYVGTQGQDGAWNVGYTGFEEALDRFGPKLEQAVDVAARNIDANELLLAEAGADPSSPQAQQLRDLYTFQWKDDGRAVAQYTDWIAEYSASEDPEQVRQAKNASAGLIDFATDTGDPDKGVPNTFKTLMQGMTPDEMYDEDAPQSLGEVNPLLAQSIGRVAASNLDAFGGMEVHESEHDTAFEEDGTVSISVEDRGAFLTLVATDETAARQLSRTIGAYEQARLDQALNADPPDPNLMREVGVEANRLDGYMAAALHNASEISADGEYKTKLAAYEEHMRYASTGKALVKTAIDAIPEVGGPIANVMGLFFDAMIDESIKPPEPPEGYPLGPEDDEGFLKQSLTYDYVAAQLRSGHITAEAIRNGEVLGMNEDFLDEHGNLKPLSELSQSQRAKLDDHLVGKDPKHPADPMYQHYLADYQGASPFNSTSLNDVDMYLETKHHRR